MKNLAFFEATWP